jgi:cytoskeletal protein CcmA (bactofilin family)
MWERKSKRKAQKRIESLIGSGTVVDGNITFVGGLRVDGNVKGSVIAADGDPATLVLGEHARVEGDVRVSHVVVNGTITGDVNVDEHLELQPKARVIGDVSYGSLEMHKGAVVQGRLQHAEPAASSVVEFRRASDDGSTGQGSPVTR